MTHINRGVRKILEIPIIYNLFHNITGGNKFRETYFDTYFNLVEGARVLDIGCGSGVMLEHISESLNYIGIDFEEGYIDYCKQKYGERGQFIHDKVDDNIKEDWLDYFDAINAHGLIHHLNDTDAEHLLESSYKYLKPGGYMVTFDTCYHEDQSGISKWFVSKDRGQNVKTTDEYLLTAKKYFSKVEGTLYKNYSRLPYSAFAMKLIK